MSEYTLENVHVSASWDGVHIPLFVDSSPFLYMPVELCVRGPKEKLLRSIIKARGHISPRLARRLHLAKKGRTVYKGYLQGLETTINQDGTIERVWKIRVDD